MRRIITAIIIAAVLITVSAITPDVVGMESHGDGIQLYYSDGSGYWIEF